MALKVTMTLPFVQVGRGSVEGTSVMAEGRGGRGTSTQVEIDKLIMKVKAGDSFVTCLA